MHWLSASILQKLHVVYSVFPLKLSMFSLVLKMHSISIFGRIKLVATNPNGHYFPFLKGTEILRTKFISVTFHKCLSPRLGLETINRLINEMNRNNMIIALRNLVDCRKLNLSQLTSLIQLLF